MSLDFLIGLLLGSCITLPVLPLVLRRYLRNKMKLRKLIAQMYHKDLLPEICRTEGMLMLYEIENPVNSELRNTYAAMALKSVRRHKERVSNLIKEYEPFQ